VLQRTVGVDDAHVSYATGRVTLRWRPDRVSLAELAGRIAALGYRPRILGEESAPDRDLLVRLGVAAFAAVNVMTLSIALYAGWFGAMAPRFAALFQWASLVLATPVALWCAQPFYRGAWSGLHSRILHMDVPIALAVSVLYGHGLIGTLSGWETYLDSLTMLVALLLGGRLLETSGRRRASEAAVTLAASVPARARRVAGDAIEDVGSADLVAGDRFVTGSGEEFPADGVVEEGTGSVRVALVTGESEPEEVAPGDEVWAGTVLIGGALTVRVTDSADKTVVRRMARTLEEAADRGTRPSSTDRIAPWFTGVTLIVAGLSLLGWWWSVGISSAMPVTIAVLVVACPCALALARPLAAAAGLGAAARRGLLFRSADALLDLAEVDLVVLDKTGTVTEGEMTVVSADDADLRVAAGLERYSRHPIAEAIVVEAAGRGIPLPSASDVREVAGSGIEGVVDGKRWRLRAGGTGGVIVLEGDGGHRGIIRLGDAVRPDSARAVRRLQAAGLEVVLLTGDDAGVADRIAEAAGIATVHARVSPEGKAQWIERARQRGRRVLFAGDGLNDGPALVAADVGVAMGTGVASSVLAADGVLGSRSILPLVAGFEAGRACRRTVRTNQIRSIAYNVSAVAAAAAGLVNPLVAAVLMPLSSTLVVVSSLRVERVVRKRS
jgi:heavy metal translocating P-type ATPase